MTTLSLDHDTLTVRFTRLEKIAGVIRDLDVPLEAIRGVEFHADGLAATRGVRAPGLGLPGLRLIGTWRAPGRNELVAVRRGQPALRLELAGHRRDALVLGVDDAAGWAERLQARTARA